jgi:predicted enzyme related to lactoylglutathione lyase
MTQEKALQGSTELYKRPKHGEFCWVELASNNIEACKPFYTELFGWHISTSTSVPSINYTEFGVNEKVRSGGMFQMNEQWHDASNKKFDSHWEFISRLMMSMQ